MARNDEGYTLYWVQRLESDGQWADVQAFGDPPPPLERAKKEIAILRDTQRHQYRIVKRVTTVEEE